MNLYFRLVWALLRSAFLPPIAPDDTLVIRRRVWLNDIDVNVHMNNGRYFTVVDLSLIEFFARARLLKACLRNKWRPMAGGTFASFRRGLAPAQAYDLRFRWQCSDGGWHYMTYEFVANGRLHAAGMLKGGIVGRSGLIDMREALPQMPSELRPALAELLSRPLTPEVIAWQQAEQSLVDSTKSNVGYSS